MDGNKPYGRWTDGALNPERIPAPKTTFDGIPTQPVRRARLYENGTWVATIWTDGKHAAGVLPPPHDSATRNERQARGRATGMARQAQAEAYRRGERAEHTLDPARYAPEYELGEIQEAERASSPWPEQV